jgi:hypothetical protein
VLTLTFRVRNGTALKGKAALTCAVAPVRGPQRRTSGSPHRAALRERVRSGDLRPELGRGTCSGPPYRNCNLTLILRQLGRAQFAFDPPPAGTPSFCVGSMIQLFFPVTTVSVTRLAAGPLTPPQLRISPPDDVRLKVSLKNCFTPWRVLRKAAE